MNTNGGAYIGGSVNVGSGKFTSRDSYEVSTDDIKGENGVILAGEPFDDDSILCADFIGDTLKVGNKKYKLHQPISQVSTMFVYDKV